MTATRHIPVEIWHQVILHVPLQYKKRLLNVSRLFHDLTLPFLFSSVKIFFIGDIAGEFVVGYPYLGAPEIFDAFMQSTWEILSRIIRDAKFAQLVKSITVVAFANSMAIFEQLTFLEALHAMKSLRSFRWIGQYPGISEEVLVDMPPSVQSLFIQSRLASTVVPLNHLHQLTQLQLPAPFYYPEDLHDDAVVVDEALLRYAEQVDIEQTVNNISASLRSLSILSTSISQVPVRIHELLTELEICVAEGTDDDPLNGLDLVFRHATALESLSLVGFIVADASLYVLPEDLSVLPRLSSFRLSCEFSAFHDEELYALSRFLEGRALLKRLYVRISGVIEDFNPIILPIIGKMHGLEVLGLHTGTCPMESSWAELLAIYLPKGLQALQLAFAWEHSESSILPLMNTLAQLPKLEFLHLFDIQSRLPPIADDIAYELKGLKMVGLNRALWDVERVGPESAIELFRWPIWKVMFCSVEDFRCDDDAWLFKYH